MRKSKNIKPSGIIRGRNIGIIFIFVALMPALIYSAYELGSLSSTEELIQSIYAKQLDAILFSINQYALDYAQGWSGEINALLASSGASDLDHETKVFLTKRRAIQAVIFADSTGDVHSYVRRESEDQASEDNQSSVPSMKNQSSIIEKLIKYTYSGYRKLEPVLVGDSASGRRLMLMFATASRAPQRKIVGFLINERYFLTDVLQAKLMQTSGDEFLLAVFDRRNKQIILTTSPVDVADLREVKDFWLLPGYSIGIKLKGASVEDLVRSRSEKNLILIGILDALLIAAVWLMYRSLKKEVELVRLKGDFVSSVSHELRTPLSLIRMFTETLTMKRVQTEEKKQEYYETILQESERLTRLVNNILNFSRMEAGKKQYHFEQVSLNEIVNGVMKTYASHLQNEGFATSMQLCDGLPLIQADREAVAEALINILDNAAKYSASEKYVRIRTGQKNSMAFIEVEDHGIGIEKHHHKKIFETFYRVSTGLMNNIKGSGLGLSLVSHIVDAHKGTIELESAPGKGSTFRIFFPIANRPDSMHKGTK
jgi:two-component system, OmpR family, phosphate regulon sensor histidine kinase PhoR